MKTSDRISVFIIVRDQVSYAKQCLDSMLHPSGIFDFYLVDHGSTYKECVQWLDWMERAHFDSINVLRREGNAHPRSLWEWQTFKDVVGENQYIVTDCDVIVDHTTPTDWIEYLQDILFTYPQYHKAALGLRIDNLPQHYEYRAKVLQWEAQWWEKCIAGSLSNTTANLYDAAVDTTLALYRPLTEVPSFSLTPAIRTGSPYVARHLPWYEDSLNLSEEQIYYRDYAATGISHWLDPDKYVRLSGQMSSEEKLG